MVAVLAAVLALPAGAAEPETFLVKLRPWAGYLAASAAPVTDRWIEVAVPPGETLDEAMAEWAAMAEVEAVEPNLTVRTEPKLAVPVTGAAAGEPDPLAQYQWHMDLVQAGAAQAVANGTGVVVAILDTGVTQGGDLACHTLVDPYDAIARVAGSAVDGSGHGTHVAGTIAQCTGNGLGVAGLAPGVRLMPIRVLDRFGSGDFADLAAGIDWAREHGADVINLSLGGSCGQPWPDCGSRVVDEAIARAAAAGIVMVASAGNASAAFADFPANHPDVIGVGAVETRQLRPLYSNLNPDLAAPGGEGGVDRNGDGTIDGVIQESFSGGVWGYWARAGTSFAAPHVAGAAALLRSYRPGATAAEVRGALQCTAADLGAPGYDAEHGHGLIRVADAAAALAAGTWDPSPPDFPPGAVVTATAVTGGDVQLAWPPATDCDRVAHYAVTYEGQPLGIFTGPAARGPGPGRYEVRAVDPAGNVSALLATDWQPPQVLAASGAGDLPGLVDPGQGRWHLFEPGGAVASFYYGNPGDSPFLGDWDCDGVDTPGLYRRSDGFVYLRNANTAGVADLAFFFGDPGDVPLAGDFDGDGCDTVSLYRPSESRVYVINRLGDAGRGLGAADFAFTFGDPGDVPLVADVDADGHDEVAVARPAASSVFVRLDLAAGPVDRTFQTGTGELAVMGDWLGDGLAEPGAWRPATLDFRLPQGTLAAPWAGSHWLPIAGATGE